ncbi:FAD binding domain-containing protein [Nonomuraea monospora]
MKPAPFTYLRARTRAEVDEALTEFPDAALLAGGQSLLPQLNERRIRPAALVDVNALQDEPEHPSWDGDGLRIGPIVRQAALERSPEVARHAPLLATALRKVAYPAVRSRGTLVGALAHAHPRSELPATFVLLGGTVQVRSSGGTRKVEAGELFTGPCRTSLRPGEWIEGVNIPGASPTAGFGLAEFSRRGADFALCGAVARADQGRISLVWFGRGATPRPHSLPGTSHQPLAARIAQHVREMPHFDGGDAAYHHHLASSLAMRAVRQALKEASPSDDPR